MRVSGWKIFSLFDYSVRFFCWPSDVVFCFNWTNEIQFQFQCSNFVAPLIWWCSSGQFFLFRYSAGDLTCGFASSMQDDVENAQKSDKDVSNKCHITIPPTILVSFFWFFFFFLIFLSQRKCASISLKFCL